MSIAITYNKTLNELEEVQAIIQGCISKNRSAQARLYQLFYPKMLAMVKRYFPQQEIAEEIINIGFLKIFNKIDTYQFKGSFEGWIRRIVFHSISDYVRSNSKYTSNVTCDDKEYFIPSVDSDNILYKDLLKLVQDLPENTRMVFNMYVMEGMTHKKISEVIGISEGTSKWYLSEARKILKEKIKSLNLL